MNLHTLARQRAAQSGPIGVALIGAGKFGSMFLAQVPSMPGLQVRVIADLYPDRVPDKLSALGWTSDRISATRLVADGSHAAGDPSIDVVVEATGDPLAGVKHALATIAAGKHIVMVNVEADALVGPALAARARQAGVVYSLAYGDQPALIAELVDWGRACGFRVAAAGKGTKHLPAFHASTPESVWDNFGISAEAAQSAGMNRQMFNSFVDGTKSAIEMAAVANACALQPPHDGLQFPPCGVDDLADILGPRSRELGGAGFVEVVSSLHHDGSQVERDLRWGVFVVLEALSAYAAACFKQYGMQTDRSGVYAAMYRPFHLIGMELGVSIYSAVLRGEATGAPAAFRGDAVSVAKRGLAAGELLDGEGGFTVWAKLIPAPRSVAMTALPIGLAKDVRLRRPVAAGEILRLEDVDLSHAAGVQALRRESQELVAG